MPALLAALLLFLVALFTITAWALARGPLAWRKVTVSRTVSVALKSGPSISGVLVSQRGELLVLARARLLEEGAPPTAIDGEVVVELRNVAFVQVLAAPSEV